VQGIQGIQGPIPATPFLLKSAAYTIVSGDLGCYFICSGGSWTLSLPGAVSGFWFRVRNDQGLVASGTITLNPPSGTINGGASLALLPGQEGTVICDGTNWRTLGLQREVIVGTQDISTSTANGVVLLPVGYRLFELSWNGLIASVGNNYLWAVASVNGGSTWINAYWTSTVANVGTTGNASGSAGNSATQVEIGSWSGTAGSLGQIFVRLYPGNATTAPTLLNLATGYYDTGTYEQIQVVGAQISGPGPVNALKYYFNTGNITQSYLTVKGIV
jgi:hypothetical protein